MKIGEKCGDGIVECRCCVAGAHALFECHTLWQWSRLLVASLCGRVELQL